MHLRKYQEEALSAIVDNLKVGVRHQLVVLATGLGKTVIAAQLPSVLKLIHPGKMLFVAHRDELLKQAIDKISKWNPELKVGLEKAEVHADTDCDVIVACSASIGRSGTSRMDSFWDSISVIVVDECQHILGDTYLSFLEASGVLKAESTKLLIGLTATPKRRNRIKDGKISTLDDPEESLLSLKSVFQKIVFSYPLKKGINNGFLVPLRGFRVSTKTSLDEVKTLAGDFQVDQLSTAVNTHERNVQVVQAWKEYAEGRPTICFTVDIKHGKDIADTFTSNGVTAQAIWGTDPLREEKIEQLETGKVQVLCNCALLTEGFDSPTVSCIILARPTRSGTLMIQQVGRGTRLHPSKKDCIVLDICDNTRRNSLVTFPSLLGLNPEMDLHGESITKAVQTLEELQEKHLTVDFGSLTDITKVKTYIESVDLFLEPFSEDVKRLSHLSWISSADGSYVLSIPERQELTKAKAYARYVHEKLHVKINELEEYELSITTTETERKLGTFNTLQEAFESADDVVRRCRPDRLKLMLRDAPWQKTPASDAAKNYLKRLTKKKPTSMCLCPGDSPKGYKCSFCGLQQGVTAGQVSLALNKLRAK
jgi:ATP-dependent helicase IRC3